MIDGAIIMLIVTPITGIFMYGILLAKIEKKRR